MLAALYLQSFEPVEEGVHLFHRAFLGRGAHLAVGVLSWSSGSDDR